MSQLRHLLEQLAPSSKTEKTTPPLYESEVLTPEEEAEAIRLAREQKYNARIRREYLEELKKAPAIMKYTPADLWNYLKTTRSSAGKLFKIDADNKAQIEQICLYFAQDDRFDGDLNKGLMLMGPLGTGKTHIMATFYQNQNASFAVVKTRTIENAWINEAKEQDPKIIDLYSANRVLAINENRFGHKVNGICFDDAGSESMPSKRYGEEKNVIAEIIMNRYDNKLPFNTTHITTNLTAGEFEKAYGSRLRDRLREMCNQIIFTGKSRR
jgi:DNA replication protein DnaC